MRVWIAVYVITVVASTLASCTSLMVGDTRVYGMALHRVTLADVRAAIDADERAPGEHLMAGEHIDEIDVISKDEICIYHGRRLEGLWPHCVIRRVNGKWRYAGEILMTS